MVAIHRNEAGECDGDVRERLEAERANREGMLVTDVSLVARGLHPILRARIPICERPQMGFMNPRVDPERDEDRFYPEDFPDDVAESLEHHCIVLTPDKWMCEDCGVSFDRDANLGDYPESCIIEGGAACVAYVPEEQT